MAPPRLLVLPNNSQMFVRLPEVFLSGDEKRRTDWLRDRMGKGSRVRTERGVYRASRDQFWRLLNALVQTFGETVVSVDRSPGHRLPRALDTVGWLVVSEARCDSGMVRRTWLVTRETILLTPWRSGFLWRNSA